MTEHQKPLRCERKHQHIIWTPADEHGEKKYIFCGDDANHEGKKRRREKTGCVRWEATVVHPAATPVQCPASYATPAISAATSPARGKSTEESRLAHAHAHQPQAAPDQTVPWERITFSLSIIFSICSANGIGLARGQWGLRSAQLVIHLRKRPSPCIQHPAKFGLGKSQGPSKKQAVHMPPCDNHGARHETQHSC